MFNLKFHFPKYIFLGILVLLLAFVALVGGTMPYFILYIFLLAFIIPLVHSFILALKLSGSINMPQGYYFIGEDIYIDYFIKNNFILPLPNITINHNILTELTGSVFPSKLLSLSRKDYFSSGETITLKRRGYYDLASIQIRISDVFGLYSFTTNLTSHIDLLVYPRPISLSSFQLFTSQDSGQLSVPNSIFQNKTNITSIRDYRPGDSIKSIHWKLSAKTNELIVKEYDKPGHNNMIIFLDSNFILFENDIDRRLEDKAAEVALSLVNHSLIKKIKVSLNTQMDKKIIKIEGDSESDLRPFLDTLARFRGNGSSQLESLVHRQINDLYENSTLIIITPKLNKGLGALSLELKSRKLNPIFIIITDKQNKNGYIDLKTENFLNLESIPIYILDYNTNTREILEVHYE